MKNLSLIIFLFVSYCATAQNFPGRTPTPNDTLISPKVLPDNRVSISIYAPKASEITIMGDFLKSWEPLKLIKNETGIWSVILGPLDPEIYTYDLTIDGVKTLDPKNNWYKENTSVYSNMFELPGKETEFLSLQDVPHGNVEMVWYKSQTLGRTRRMHIYTPPGYDKMQEKLPVLYLLHGGGDNDGTWTSAGRANFILDNLLAGGKIKPMLVVMPAGHVPGTNLAMGAGPDQDPFCLDFLNDIMPYVDNHYRTMTERDGRAIAGLSMGGIQVLNIALFNPEKFGYVIPLSTGYFPPVLKELEDHFSNILKNPEINKFRLFWIGMGGEKDIAFTNNKNMMALFDRYGIKYDYHESSNGHTYLTWRKDLYHFAPLLFR
jgi:enterochelin esterase-like enzyme